MKNNTISHAQVELAFFRSIKITVNAKAMLMTITELNNMETTCTIFLPFLLVERAQPSNTLNVSPFIQFMTIVFFCIRYMLTFVHKINNEHYVVIVHTIHIITILLEKC